MSPALLVVPTAVVAAPWAVRTGALRFQATPGRAAGKSVSVALASGGAVPYSSSDAA